MPLFPLTARLFIALGAVLAALSVALSAAAAHVPALQQAGPAFAASLDQHQFHALGLVLVGLTLARRASGWLVASGCLMVAGLLLFCLNINARILWGWDATRALVPLGGSAFILAWLALAVGVLWPAKGTSFGAETSG
jgi:uncharacterized membrane protein YgdD (TMEM256/DUF423 family)